MKNEKNNRAAICLIVATCSMVAGALLLKNEPACGFFSIVGLWFFIASFRLSKNKKQFIAVTICFWLGMSVRFIQMVDGQPMVQALISLCTLLYCVVFAGGFYLEKGIRSSRLYWLSPLVFPILNTLTIIFTVLIGMGNLENLCLYIMCIPVFSYNLIALGEYGLTFILSLILSLTANLPVSIDKKEKKNELLLAVGILMVLLINGSAYSFKETAEPDYTLNIAVATNEQQDMMGNSDCQYNDEDYIALFRNAVETAVENKADLLMLNEEFCFFTAENKEELLACYVEIIKENHLPVLLCAETEYGDDELSLNDATFYDENGEIVYYYIKNNFVPFIEAGEYVEGDGQPGSFTYTINGHSINFALVICFDINDDFLMQKINDSTELFLVPSWNWNYGNVEQKTTRIRSIELNTTILNHSYEGFTYVSGPNGLIGDYIDTRQQYEKVWLVEVPIWEK